MQWYIRNDNNKIALEIVLDMVLYIEVSAYFRNSIARLSVPNFIASAVYNSRPEMSISSRHIRIIDLRWSVLSKRDRIKFCTRCHLRNSKDLGASGADLEVVIKANKCVIGLPHTWRPDSAFGGLEFIYINNQSEPIWTLHRHTQKKLGYAHTRKPHNIKFF